MKKLIAIFGVLAFTAGMAFAQNNQSTVEQTGDGNTAIIEQIGFENVSVVGQESEGTPGVASAEVYQFGEKNISILDLQDAFFGDSEVTVDQIGNDNEVRLQTQNGGGQAFISMEGNQNILQGWRGDPGSKANQKDPNYFSLDIVGNNNIIGMSQERAHAEIDISGNSNEIDLLQLADSGHETYIDIDGNENLIDVMQVGEGGRFDTGGFDNYAKIDIIGGSNTVDIMQWGSDHSSINTVNGHNNTIEVIQKQ